MSRIFFRWASLLGLAVGLLGLAPLSLASAQCDGEPAPPEHGTHPEVCSGTENGGMCTLVCDPGFIATDAVCSMGTWRQGRCEPAPCDVVPVEPANGRHPDAASCAGTPHGSRCDVLCDEGFMLDRVTICVEGAWEIGACSVQIFDRDGGTTDPPDDRGGCGCRSAGAPGSSSAAGFLLGAGLLGLLLFRRRR